VCQFRRRTAAAVRLVRIPATITVSGIRVEAGAMSEFSDLLRMILDDPDAFNSKIRTQLDPNLVDQLTAYAASRNVPLPQTVLKALEL
jgi:hypothetical protein